MYICIDWHVCWNIKRLIPLIVCLPRKTNFRFPYIYTYGKRNNIYLYIHMHIHSVYRHIYTAVNGKWKMKAQAFFLIRLPFCSLYKQKFVISLFVGEEINGSYPFENRLNGLAHLCPKCHGIACSTPDFWPLTPNLPQLLLIWHLIGWMLTLR